MARNKDITDTGVWFDLESGKYVEEKPVEGRRIVTAGSVVPPHIRSAIDAGVETATADDGDVETATDDGTVVACDVDGCDYSGTPRGLKIHTGQVHA